MKYNTRPSAFVILVLVLFLAQQYCCQAHRLPNAGNAKQKASDPMPMGAWGFSKNIINIDTFFAAPTRSEPKSLSQKGKKLEGGEATAEALEEHQETAEEKRQREIKEKVKKEQEEKERLKKLVEKEAAEKAVEAIMISLDADSGEDSEEEEEDDSKENANATKPVVINATAKAIEERERIRQEQLDSFEHPTLFTIIFSTPSAPDDVKQQEKNCSTLTEVQEFFSNDMVKGLKMLFSNGQLLKTNVNYQDNEFEYYRLVGEAYNTHKLDRVSVESKQVQLLQSGDGKQSLAAAAANTVFFTYVVDGVPQTLAHNTLNDAKYGYSKQVFVKAKKSPDATSESYKLYSTSCSKLPQNKNNEGRLRDCRLASGYFLVNQVGLFKTLCNAGSDGFSREAMQKCGVQMKQVTVQ